MMELHIPDGLLNDKMMVQQKEVFITHEDNRYKLIALRRADNIMTMRFEAEE